MLCGCFIICFCRRTHLELLAFLNNKGSLKTEVITGNVIQWASIKDHFFHHKERGERQLAHHFMWFSNGSSLIILFIFVKWNTHNTGMPMKMCHWRKYSSHTMPTPADSFFIPYLLRPQIL